MKVCVGIVLILFSFFSYAGPLPPDNLSCQTLRVWLKENWHEGKHNDLGYNEARRTMYSFIDKDTDNMVTGVYSGFKQRARDTTFLNPINAEHTIPQSWFNEKSPMRSDLHHLFPTHKNVNSTRSDSPFDEIDDNLTEKWITAGDPGLKIIRDNIPTDKIDSFSEVIGNEAFEPREDHKGNLARAVYYFYTMYPHVAGDISNIAKKEVLFQWHQDDPVDAAEKERNNRIEERQGNRNPYIDHPELVILAWGNDDNGGIDPDIIRNIEALKAEIKKLETTLENLKTELSRLENSLIDE
jgi:endonuclease I